MTDLLNVVYRCAYCGENNETLVDPTEGNKQQYTEDCAVCCRPNVLTISISREGEVALSTEYEG